MAPRVGETPPLPISASVKRRPPKPLRQSNRVVDLDQPGFLSLRDVLAIFPVSRSSWYAGIKKGKACGTCLIAPLQNRARCSATASFSVTIRCETSQSADFRTLAIKAASFTL